MSRQATSAFAAPKPRRTPSAAQAPRRGVPRCGTSAHFPALLLAIAVASLAALAAPALALAIDGGSETEAEPNNSTSQADAGILRLTQDTSIDAAITPVGDKDFFRVEAPASETEATFVAQDGTGNCRTDMVLRIYNAGGTELGSTGSMPGQCAGARLVQAGTYYVSLEDRDNNATVSSYTLAIDFSPPGDPPQCLDQADNDSDAKVDFPADPGCSSISDDDESNVPQCSNGTDDDNDGKTDHPSDPGCTAASDDSESPDPPPPPQCSNGTDDDNDGKTDHPADPGCTAASDDSESSDSEPEAEPNNSKAEADAGTLRLTGDKTISAAITPVGDKDFFRVEAPASETQGTFVAQDGTGNCRTDMVLRIYNAAGAELGSTGPGCAGARLVQAGTYYVSLEDHDNNATVSSYTLAVDFSPPGDPPQCLDQVDNDSDAKVDFPADPGCSSISDDDETNVAPPPPQCSNGTDDDMDGKTDHPADPGCTSASDTSESPDPDATPPETSLVSGPSGTVGATNASFSFTSSEPGGRFECRLDGASTWSSCSSPKSYSSLSEGPHTFEVRALDAAGNVDATPATRTWKVDSVAPNTTIASGPAGTVRTTSASFGFSSSETGSRFECRRDTGSWSACTSPKAYSGLGQGAHTFEVRAFDGAGNPDATPAKRTWKVDTVAPKVTAPSPASGATGVSTTANVLATFSEAMKASTVTKTTVKLVRKGTTTPVAATVTYDASRRRATLNPSSGLRRGATYTATVTRGAKDLAGNPLQLVKAWSFTVRR